MSEVQIAKNTSRLLITHVLRYIVDKTAWNTYVANNRK